MSEHYFSSANLEARDIVADRASMAQRIEVFRDQQPADHPALIVRKPEDKTPSADAGIPEVSVEELTVAGMRASIAEHGALLVRNMFASEETDVLKKTIDRVLDVSGSPRGKRIKHASAYYNPPGNLASIMPEKGMELGSLRMFNSASGGVMCVEAPSVAETLLKFYEEHGIKKMVSEYRGEPPCLSAKKWVLRRSLLPMEEAGWHQDGAFMGTDINTINLWVPLTECGGETGCPGMDIVPQRLYEIASAEGATFDWSVSDTHIRGGAFECLPVAPVFNAGDAFFFDLFYLHRTQFHKNIDKIRYAVECWFFGSTSFPKSQIPVQW
jgi:hypothetical protein